MSENKNSFFKIFALTKEKAMLLMKLNNCVQLPKDSVIQYLTDI